MSDIVRTRGVLDELISEDGAVVLVGSTESHRVVRLSVLGQLIRELAIEGISIDSLVGELEVILGPPGEGESTRLVAEAVAALEADGLVSWLRT